MIFLDLSITIFFQEVLFLATSEAKQRAKKRYEGKTYKRLTLLFKLNEFKILDKFCKINGYTKNGFTVSAIMKRIEKETGKTIEELQKDYEKLDDPRSVDDLDVLEEYTFKDKNINNINDIENIEAIKNIENIEDIEDIEG